MARKKMVTRTFKMTDVMAVSVNLETGEMSHDFVAIPGTYESEDKALAYIAKMYNTDVFKYVKVESMTAREVLKGMTEEFFFDNSEVMPPRN